MKVTGKDLLILLIVAGAIACHLLDKTGAVALGWLAVAAMVFL